MTVTCQTDDVSRSCAGCPSALQQRRVQAGVVGPEARTMDYPVAAFDKFLQNSLINRATNNIIVDSNTRNCDLKIYSCCILSCCEVKLYLLLETELLWMDWGPFGPQ